MKTPEDYPAGHRVRKAVAQTGSHLGQWMEVEDDGRTMPSGMAERLNNQGNALVRQLQAKGADLSNLH